MGSMFRSEKMVRTNLYLESDCAYACVAEMGELGCLQFLDLNSSTNAAQRKFVSWIRRCEEIERKIRYVISEAKSENINIPSDEFLHPPTPSLSAMNEIETQMEKMEEKLNQSTASVSVLKEDFSSLVELCHVVRNSRLVFEQCNYDPEAIRENFNLGFSAATILREKVHVLERLLFFACGRNVLIRVVPIDDKFEEKQTKKVVIKSAVFVFFQGEQLKTRVRKILEGTKATIYQCPDTIQESDRLLEDVKQRIQDMMTVLEKTTTSRKEQLTQFIVRLPDWSVQIKKVKAVMHILNGFDMNSAQRYMIGECWCPLNSIEEVRNGLLTATQRSNSPPSAAILSIIESQSASSAPPTFNRTNKFNRVFQSVVNAYGIATYEEVNPAPFIIISFPFLFSVMFGDAGHGVLLLGAAVAMVLLEDRFTAKTDNEIWNIFFGGRYIILLMGLFSIYSGLIYNDIFAKPFNIFGSAWIPEPSKYHDLLLHEKSLTLEPMIVDNESDFRGVPYAFGMDPIWQMAINKITWSNSFKMKISICFGICHMIFGVILSAFNHRHFKNTLNIMCEFLPEMLFLMAMFGYLVVLIFYKWIAIDATRSACSPSLLINLINMFLISYKDEPCQPTNFYQDQKSFQIFLLLVVVICIPWLLLPKPLILRRCHKQQLLKNQKDHRVIKNSTFSNEIQNSDIELNQIRSPANSETAAPPTSGHGDHEEFNFGDVFIHQCIHTIEFCLGCISHTASYLRLWALSLAHAQLSEVLWFMVLRTALTIDNVGGGGIVLFFLFAPWAFLTIAILLLMEGLSAFLHTLRLHWVEFQSKFYKGEGYKFAPFSFEKILSKSLDD